jgi:hypothetical protein
MQKLTYGTGEGDGERTGITGPCMARGRTLVGAAAEAAAADDVAGRARGTVAAAAAARVAAAGSELGAAALA